MPSCWSHLYPQLLKASGQTAGSRPIPVLSLERPVPPRLSGVTDEQMEVANGRGPVPGKLFTLIPVLGQLLLQKSELLLGVVTAL